MALYGIYRHLLPKCENPQKLQKHVENKGKLLVFDAALKTRILVC